MAPEGHGHTNIDCGIVHGGRPISDEMFDQFAVYATYDQVAARIKERWGGIVNRTAFYMPLHHEGDKERLWEIIRQIQAI